MDETLVYLYPNNGHDEPDTGAPGQMIPESQLPMGAIRIASVTKPAIGSKYPDDPYQLPTTNRAYVAPRHQS